jgi:hypothetical protein
MSRQEALLDAPKSAGHGPERAAVTITRNVDPEVGKARGKLGIAVLKGDEQAVEECRQQLHEAKIIAAAKAVAARLPELSPEKREHVRALLGGA